MVCVSFLVISQGRDNLQLYIQKLGFWAPLGLFSLRFISVVIPAIPGTAFAAFSGILFGFWPGLAIICLADLCSCTTSFLISRHFGRHFVQKVMGQKSIYRIDRLCQNYLSDNLLLMTGFLMTGFFDFVSYGIGLAKTPMRKFLPALVTSILLSNPPVVALSVGLFQGGKVFLILAAFGLIGLGILTQLLKQKFLTSGEK